MIPPRRPSKVSKKTSRILRPTLPAKAGKKADKFVTPIDRKQQALREKEAQLKEATEQLKQLIEDAPRRREEQTRRRREQLAGDPRLSSRTALVDKRFTYNAAAAATLPSGKRRLRIEKKEGKLFFIFLCVVFVIMAIWLYQLIAGYLHHF